MKKSSLGALGREKTHDSLDNLQLCADSLGPLLEMGNSGNLTPSQLDAVRYLCSAYSPTHDHPRGRFSQKLHLRQAKIRESRLMSKMEKCIKDSLHEARKSHDSLSKGTIQDILDTYGGHAVLHRSVQFQAGTNQIKVIQLEGTGRIESRINLLIDNYNKKGRLNLWSVRLSSDFTADETPDFNQNCPPEWNALTTEAKVKLARLLSWESLSKWEFNIVEVANLTRDPLLLVGWALLCEPMAQEAMQLSLGVNFTGNEKSYDFGAIKINPRTICNFLREIEKRYKLDNPYHNNIHAADVTQTAHCLFQLMDEQYRKCIFDPIAIFSLLLAATFHDVGHPGTNNLYQKNAMTQFAIEYNDVSILENMHSAVGNSLLFGKEKREEWDIFEGWTHHEKVHARNIMTGSILFTDMSNHFAHVKELDSQVRKLAKDISVDDSDTEIEDNESEPILSILAQKFDDTDAASELEEWNQLADLIIKFLLHAADISNPAKTADPSVYWANCALDEFFAQGDKEKEMGLPISPLCDRGTVKRHDSQIGFIEMVIRPTFEFLGDIIPRVKEDVMPVIDNNLEYWQKEKSRLSTQELV